MHAGDTTYRKMLDGSKQFIVPVFQRDYKWSRSQWQRLWDDIGHASSGYANLGHFLGSLVQIDTGRSTSSFSSWLVIDGQQRLATLTLLLAALRDHIAVTGWDGNEESPTVDLLDDVFLKNRNFQGDRNYKLSLRRTDDATLHVLVDGKALDSLEGNPSGQIADAYQFFKEKLKDCDPAIIYNSVASLRIVEVTLNREFDDPQFVFESLNDTGVDLSEGDKVRNYLLMSLPEQEQNDLYTEYWSKIEGYFRGQHGDLDDGRLSEFLRNYITLKRKDQQQVRLNRIYDEFKKSRNAIQAEDTLEQLLAEMRRFAGYYAAFEGFMPMPSHELTNAMRNTHSQGITPGVLIMRLYDCYHNQQTLTEEDFVRSLRLIESYILRHAICGHQIRSFRRIFAEMTLDIDEKVPAESLRLTLAKPRGSYGFWNFQSDSAFSDAIQTTNLAQFQICKYILGRLEESFGSKESISTEKLTIEHIMPQSIEGTSEPNLTWGKKWQTMLGDDWRQVHTQWLHRLGNLTLTGYNPDMSNRPFEEKKSFYSESPLRLTKFVRQQSEWTAVEMEARGKELAARALKIWPYPQVK